MNQYEPVISVYVRGYTFIEEKPIDQECVNKFWIKVNEASSMPNPPFSQKLIDEAKKKCQNMLNPNVPEFQPQNNKVVEGVSQQNFLITNYIESQNVQEAEDVYQNYSENYNCQTDMQNGFASSDQDNFTPSEPYQWLERQNIPEGYYNPYQSNFEDHDSSMSTGSSSSDEENWTPTDSAQWLGQEVAQVTEGLFNPYQNHVDNVWLDNYYLSTQ
jgi:hypothetical protein